MDITGILEETQKKPRVYGVEPEWQQISPVGINDFPIPRLLLELIARDVWNTLDIDGFPNDVFSTERELTLYGLNMNLRKGAKALRREGQWVVSLRLRGFA